MRDIAAPADKERERVRWGLPDFVLGFVVAFVLAALATPIARSLTGVDSELEYDDLPLSTLAIVQAFFFAGMLGSALVAAWVRGNGPVRDFGLRQRLIDTPIGLVIGVAVQFFATVLYWPLLWLTDYTQDDLDKPARELADKANGAGVVVLIVLVAVAAPIVEEIFYRGLLLRTLERMMPTAAAVIVSAAVFAASHFQLLQFPALFVFGVVAAILVVRTGRLGPAIWAHLGFNLIAAIFLLR
jgi:hypothetical protein